MSAPTRGRGRGRGRLSETPTNDSPQASTSNLRAPTPLNSNNNNNDNDNSLPASSIASSSRRPVGGLLGGSEYVKKATGTSSGTKFKPNMTRKAKVVDPDDDEDDEDESLDVKMEDFTSSSKGRAGAKPAGRGRGREVEMTASGPMAQGPSGIPKAAPRSIYGGAGVMNAAIKVGSTSRSGGTGASGSGSNSGVRNKALASGQFEDASDDPDESDYDESDNEQINSGGRAELLDDIGLEDEMAPMNLPKDPKVLRLARERKDVRKIARVKREAPIVKPEPTDDTDSIRLSSNNGTPALDQDSRANSMDSKSTLLQPEPVVEDSKEFKPEIDIKEDFDVEDPTQEKLYIFQFPRKFPDLVDSRDVEALTPKYTNDGVKIEPDPNEGPLPSGNYRDTRKNTAPEWGRAGSRADMITRWPLVEGRMGDLRIHKSGKVTLKINNDLIYDVLPAAQPTFLQEVAVLDHDPATVPLQRGEQREDDSMNGVERERSLKIMGQTFKKFIVVPEVTHLLEKIAEQQVREAEEAAARKKAAKREKK